MKAVALLLCASCSSETTAPGAGSEPGGHASVVDTTSAMGGGAMGGGAATASYPEGPYGQNDPDVGTRIENLAFIGLRPSSVGLNLDQVDYAPVQMTELRQQALAAGVRWGLFHTATMWCPSCRSAADALAAEGDDLSRQGALIVELVLEGPGYGAAPTESELRTWVQSTGLTVTTLSPADEQGRVVFPSREYAYIVDLTTMEVHWAEQALFTSPTITERAIAKLRELL